ncbi:MAG: hypothetical protein ACKVQS_00840 [Fimbriimonadaceae bacterium]
MKRTDGSIVGHQDPVFDAFAVTPSDTADLAQVTRGVYVGGAGALKVTLAGGSTVTFTGLTAGIWPFEVVRIFATGTTATGLIGLV